MDINRDKREKERKMRKIKCLRESEEKKRKKWEIIRIKVRSSIKSGKITKLDYLILVYVYVGVNLVDFG